MSLLKRAPRPPKELWAELQIPRGERLLGATRSRSGGWVLATRDCLYVTDGQHAVRAPWSTVASGSLDAETSHLTVEWVEDREPLVIALRPEDGRTFAIAFRQQVDNSVVHAVHIDLPGDQYARAIIRRDGNGGLFSMVEGQFDSSEAVLQVVGKAERQVRLDVGLSPDPK